MSSTLSRPNPIVIFAALALGLLWAAMAIMIGLSLGNVTSTSTTTTPMDAGAD